MSARAGRSLLETVSGPRRQSLRRITGRLAKTRAFAALGRRMAPVDALLYRVTRGRLTILGPQGRAMPPTLLLTTKGRRSREPRTTPLMYLPLGSGFAVTSESFGQQRPAAWPLNLDANPHATVQIGKRIVRCRARRATDDELDQLWPRFVAIWPAHEAYLSRSGVRHTFILEPQADVESDR
jgi:deazaflavin-dependent oxidoreductase (nitroreductase family)